MCQKRDDLNKQILQCRSELSKICPAILVHSIRTKIQEVRPFYSCRLSDQASEWQRGCS